jgi:hypothetical protein
MYANDSSAPARIRQFPLSPPHQLCARFLRRFAAEKLMLLLYGHAEIVVLTEAGIAYQNQSFPQSSKIVAGAGQ